MAGGRPICVRQVPLTASSSDHDSSSATQLAPDRADFSVTDAPATLGQGVAGWRRALQLLWLGQVVSHLGDSLFLGSIVYLALEVTHSKSKSGLLVAMNFLPALALGLFAGAFVDRHDRRRVMIGADLLRAIAVGAIPALYLTGRLGALALAAAVFALALGTTVFNPAIKALIPEITPLDRLTTAVSVFQISEYVALVAGPGVAVLILPRLGMAHLFTVDAATFLFSAACLLFIPREARRRMHAAARVPEQSLAALVPALLEEVAVGLRAVRADPVLRVILALAALDNLLIMGLAHVGMPVLVKETLQLGLDAIMRAQASFFMGLAAASAAFWLLGRNWPKGRLILIGIALDGLTFVPLAFCRTLGQVQLVLFIHAMAIPLIVIPRTVLIQRTVPGPLHGRTFALLNVTVFGMTAISSALVGVLAERVAPQTLFVVFGLVGVLPGAVGFAFPALRATR
jgi:MFS transporter, DHA3 family, tetracycline resistance protein